MCVILFLVLPNLKKEIKMIPVSALIIGGLVIIIVFFLTIILVNLSVEKEEKIRKRAKEVKERKGNGECWHCRGKGCSFCKDTGKCQVCRGRGLQRRNGCNNCANNYWFIKTGRDG